MSWGLLALPYLPGEWVRTNQCAGRRDVTKSPELGPRGAEGNLSAGFAGGTTCFCLACAAAGLLSQEKRSCAVEKLCSTGNSLDPSPKSPTFCWGPWSKFWHLSEPQFPAAQNGDNKTTRPRCPLPGLRDTVHTEYQLELQTGHMLPECLPLAVSCAEVAMVRGVSAPAVEGVTYQVFLCCRVLCKHHHLL